MAKIISRFTLQDGKMVPHRVGEYVLFEDFLEERRSGYSTNESRENLQKIIGQIAKLVGRDQNDETVVMAVERIVRERDDYSRRPERAADCCKE